MNVAAVTLHTLTVSQKKLLEHKEYFRTQVKTFFRTKVTTPKTPQTGFYFGAKGN